MKEKVVRQLKRSFQPAITQLHMEWDEQVKAHQTPFKIRPIFSGDRALVFAFLNTTDGASSSSSSSKKGAGNGLQRFKASLVGRLPGGDKVEFPITVDLKRACRDGKQIQTLAAREMIRDLEKEVSQFTIPEAFFF